MTFSRCLRQRVAALHSIETGPARPARNGQSRANTLLLAAIVGATAAAGAAEAQLPSRLLSPQAVFGFDPARVSVADTRQVMLYCDAIAARDDVDVKTVALSTDGRPVPMLLISSPRNLRALHGDRESTPPVILVTCGIHPEEVSSTGAFFAWVERLLAPDSRSSGVLERVVLFVVPTLNPDGTDLIAERIRSRMRGSRSRPLLHRYCGHDLNRDWLVGTQPEVRGIIERVHNVYRPSLTIDVHQMGRYGPRLFVPPYAEPNDPAIEEELLAYAADLGRRVATSLTEQGHTGIAHRWTYDAWSPARGYPFYHGGVRFLIEVASANSVDATRVGGEELWVFRDGNDATPEHPRPWPGGVWSFAEASELGALAIEVAVRLAAADASFSRLPSQTGRPRKPGGGYIVESGVADPGAVAELLRALQRGGASVRRLSRGRWRVDDPPWASGWCASLLTTKDYPTASRTVGRGTFNHVPYDTSAHNLALLTGCSVRAAPLRGTPEGRQTTAGDGTGSVSPPSLAQNPVDASTGGASTPALPSRRRTDQDGGGSGAAVESSEFVESGELSAPAETHAASTEVAWVVDQRSLFLFRHLSDLVERGVHIERFLRSSQVTPQVRAGDWCLSRIDSGWIREIVADGCNVSQIDDDLLDQPRRAGDLVKFQYPNVVVVTREAAAKDEGWLRAVLEDYRFRFRTVDIGDLHRLSSAPIRADAREVVCIADDVATRVGPAFGVELRRLVARGARVFAMGRSAAKVANFGMLPVSELYVGADAFPGTLLNTRFNRDKRNQSAPSPLLWGVGTAPIVLYDRGPVWRSEAVHRARDRTPTSEVAEAVLLVDGEKPTAAGLALSGASLHSTAVAFHISGAGRRGDWVLCGFRPHYRSWTFGTFRFLFNVLLAP